MYTRALVQGEANLRALVDQVVAVSTVCGHVVVVEHRRHRREEDGDGDEVEEEQPWRLHLENHRYIIL